MEKLELGGTYYREVTVNGERVNKWVVLAKMERFDSNYKIIWFADMDGKEAWFENDSHGNRISEKRNNGQEIIWKRKYDAKGKLIWFEKSGDDEKEVWNEYDTNGNLIHQKASSEKGIEEVWVEYDSNGNRIHQKHSSEEGLKEIWSEYDSNGKCIHQKSSSEEGLEERWTEFDSNGKCIHFKKSDGYEEWIEYPSDKIRINKNSEGEESIVEADENNYVVHRHNFNGSDVWFESEYHENGKRKTVYTFIPK